MGSLDAYDLSDITQEKLDKISRDKARKEQDYFYRKQQQDMAAYIKQSLIDANQPVPVNDADLTGKAPQGIIPYLDPNKPTRMNVTDLFGKGSDADSMWGLNPLDTFYDVGVRADSGINTAEHAAYASKGSQDQLKTQRIYFGMLRGIFPPDINPAELSDDQLKQYVPDQMIFDIGKQAENLSRSAALEGWNEGEVPQLDISYDPNAQKHIGDKRVRGSAINPRTGKNIYDVANLPEYNINWFSDDPKQTAIREAYEKEHGTDYSKFQQYNKAGVERIGDTYTVTDLFRGDIYPDLTKEQATLRMRAIEQTSAPTDKLPTDSFLVRAIESFIPSSARLDYLAYPEGHKAEDENAFALANPAFDTGAPGIDTEPVTMEDVIDITKESQSRLENTEKEYRSAVSEAIGKNEGLTEQFLYSLKERKTDAFEGLLDSASLMAEISMGYPGMAAAMGDTYVRVKADYLQETKKKDEDLTKEEKATLAAGSIISAAAEKLGFTAVLGRFKLINNAVDALTIKSGVLGKIVGKILGYTGNITTEGITGVVSEQAEKSAKGVALGESILDTPLTGSEAVEAFQQEAMGAGAPAAVSSGADLVTNFTDNQMISRIQKELDIADKIALTEQEATDITNKVGKIRQTLANPNLSERNRTKLENAVAKAETVLAEGKPNPDAITPQRRAALEKRRQLILDKLATRAAAKAEKDAAAEAKARETAFDVTPADAAAPAAESAVSEEAKAAEKATTEKLIQILQDKQKEASERTQAAETLSTKLKQDQSAETAQAVVNSYEENQKILNEEETKLSSLARIIAAEDVVEPEKLKDSDLKAVYDTINEFNQSSAATDLANAAKSIENSTAPVSANILNESQQNYKSIESYFTGLVQAIKDRNTVRVKQLAQKLQRFKNSHTGKNNAIIKAVRQLKVAEPGQAVLITRTVDPNTRAISYSSKLMSLEEAKKAQKDFANSTDNERKNVFFIVPGVSDRLVGAIDIESKFVEQANEIAQRVISLAEDIETTQEIVASLETAVSDASNILNKAIPETRAETKQESKDGKQERVQTQEKEQTNAEVDLEEYRQKARDMLGEKGVINNAVQETAENIKTNVSKEAADAFMEEAQQITNERIEARKKAHNAKIEQDLQKREETVNQDLVNILNKLQQEKDTRQFAKKSEELDVLLKYITSVAEFAGSWSQQKAEAMIRMAMKLKREDIANAIILKAEFLVNADIQNQQALINAKTNKKQKSLAKIMLTGYGDDNSKSTLSAEEIHKGFIERIDAFLEVAGNLLRGEC